MANYNSTHTGQIIDATISAVIAGKAGIQGVKVNGTEITPDSSSNKVDINVPIVAQTTGTSTSEIMSQKATTDALDLKANSSSLSTVATSGSYNDLSNKPSIPSVVQVTGTSTTDVMSQDAVTTQLSTKANSSSLAAVATSGSYNDLSDKPSAPNVVQTTGSSTTEVMSQNAVTTQLNSKADSSSLATVATSGSYNDLSDKPSAPNVVQTTGSSTTEVMSQKATTDALGLKADSSSLAAVAASGSYNDLSNKPSIPSVVQVTGTSTSDVMSQDAVTTQLSTKVSQVSGKGLSTNDFTNGYKDKLDGLRKVSVNSYSMILSAANWSSTAPYTLTITSSSTTSSDEPIFDIELSSNTSTAISELESWGYVSKADTSNGQITFTCLETKPTVDLPVKMLVIKYA